MSWAPQRSADPNAFARGTGHPTSRGWPIGIGVLVRGARILFLGHKGVAVGIKEARVRPAAASVPCCIRLNQASVNVLAARFARALLSFTPSQGRGRREGRALAGTRGPLCANALRQLHSGIQGSRDIPAFPAQWDVMTEKHQLYQ